MARKFHVVFGWPWAEPGILVILGLEADLSGFWALDHRSQMADLLSANAIIPEQLSATAEQLTATAEQQTCIPYPQPYAPDKQGPADLVYLQRLRRITAAPCFQRF